MGVYFGIQKGFQFFALGTQSVLSNYEVMPKRGANVGSYFLQTASKARLCQTVSKARLCQESFWKTLDMKDVFLDKNSVNNKH